MQVMDNTRLAYRDLKPEIGAEVLADKQALLSGVHAGDIRELLERRGVLVFPRIGLSEDEQVAFTRTLGEIAPDGDGAKTTRITLEAANPSRQYAKASFFWHFDGYMNDVPVLASILCAHVLSPTGGDTEFCNTYAAYEALPQERKVRIEGLRAVHAMVGAQLSIEPEPSYERFSEWLAVRSNRLPLVWKHRSGRKSLVIGNTALNVIGLDPLEGMELLVWLRDWATQERFSYTHRWALGDMVIWDNTGTLHRATPYDPDCGRLLHRTKLAGEEPFA
jgi:alpha-ketoglutarate-dependent taurine dioxygenase